MFKAEAAMRRVGEGSVTYRMKSSPEHTTVTFTGSHITVAELRKSILQHMPKKIKKDGFKFHSDAEYDMRFTNAESQEVYNYEHTLIPSGAFLIVTRVPTSKPVVSSDGFNSFGLDIGGHNLTMAEYSLDDRYLYYPLDEWINDKVGCPLFYQYDPYIASTPNNNNNKATVNRNSTEVVSNKFKSSSA